jgi:hypothetical protein
MKLLVALPNSLEFNELPCNSENQQIKNYLANLVALQVAIQVSLVLLACMALNALFPGLPDFRDRLPARLSS